MTGIVHLRAPTDESLTNLLRSCGSLHFSYPDVGATRTVPPAGYNTDHNRIELGRGEQVFRRAVEAIRQWKMFDIEWLRLFPDNVAIEEGKCVAVVVPVAGMSFVNISRIVYILDEAGLERRFGFAYGTLGHHAESGEERFMVVWDRSSDAVTYDLLAFSRPNHPLARIAYPLSRALQKRFASCSLAAMRRAVL